jgi:hypothetical protein
MSVPTMRDLTNLPCHDEVMSEEMPSLPFPILARRLSS